MAKEAKKAAEAAKAQETKNTPAVANNENDNDNIVDEIKKGGQFTSDIAKEAIEKIEKNRKDEKVYAMQRMILEQEYTNKRARLELRQRRAEEKVTKKFLTDTKTLLEEVQNEKYTQTEYSKKKKELYEEKQKAFREISKEYDDLYRELQRQYPGYWDYNWDRYCY